MKFRQFWVKDLRHSETVPAKMGYFYRGTGRMRLHKVHRANNDYRASDNTTTEELSQPLAATFGGHGSGLWAFAHQGPRRARTLAPRRAYSTERLSAILWPAPQGPLLRRALLGVA